MISRNIALCCTGEKTGPDPDDLILIKPHETIKYPAAELHYAFNRYPKGKYSIKINYEFERKEINTFWERNVNLLILGLRGTYTSTNTAVFINK
ncbi:MAG TPA: hypothetical protein VMT35_14650 [Ignavibacteriaceae bacterium]|nr:hypothetical protein [Ignavibacteriaceae bacterium]